MNNANERIDELLACPMCKSSDLTLSDLNVACTNCARNFPRTERFPRLLPDMLQPSVATEDYGWKYWSRMQALYKQWARTDWSVEAARPEMPLYEDFIHHTKPSGKVVLDLGGCWGMNRAWLSNAAFYFVVDPDDEEANSPQMEFMKELYPFYGEPFPFIQAVAEYLPLQDQCVDIVIIQDALDHLLVATSAIHEVWRVLRPGGQLCIMADVVDSAETRGLLEDVVWILKNRGIVALLRGAFWKIREKLRPGENRHGHMTEFTRQEIVNLLSPFPSISVSEPNVKGFPHLYFIATKHEAANSTKH